MVLLRHRRAMLEQAGAAADAAAAVEKWRDDDSDFYAEILPP
jgi:hypothetical protein